MIEFNLNTDTNTNSSFICTSIEPPVNCEDTNQPKDFLFTKNYDVTPNTESSKNLNSGMAGFFNSLVDSRNPNFPKTELTRARARRNRILAPIHEENIQHGRQNSSIKEIMRDNRSFTGLNTQPNHIDPREVTIQLSTVSENEGTHTETSRQGSIQHNVENQSEQDYIKKRAISNVLIKLSVNLILFITYIISDLLIHGKITIIVPFVVFNGFAVVYLVFFIITKNFFKKVDNTQLILSIFDILGLMIYMSIAFSNARDIHILLSPFSAFGFITILCNYCKLCFDNIAGIDISANTPERGSFLMTIIKLCFWAELFGIGIAVDGFFVGWRIIFIPAYFAIGIFCLCSFAAVLYSISGLMISIWRQERISYKIMVETTLYLLNFLYPTVWIPLLVKIINYLEGEERNLDDLDIILKIGLVHSGLFFVCTFVFCKTMYKLEKSDIQNQVSSAESALQCNDNVNKKPNFFFQKENLANLFMISPTFYSFQKKTIPNLDKNELKELKTRAQQAKLKKIYHKPILFTHQKSFGPLPTDNPISNNILKRVSNYNLDFSDWDIGICGPKSGEELLETKSKNEDKCLICLENNPNAVYMNCGHGGVCYECALENWKKTDNCILCCKKIKRILKVIHFEPFKVSKVIESVKKA